MFNKNFQLNETFKDLFTVPQGYYLAHCISGDFGMGAGIAVQFNKHYNMKNKLETRHGESLEPRAILVDNVFNLVTKRHYWEKPTYANLQIALQNMKGQIKILEITKLAIPQIGCGIDGLDWEKVRGIIIDVFHDIDIEILVCVWK